MIAGWWRAVVLFTFLAAFAGLLAAATAGLIELDLQSDAVLIGVGSLKFLFLALAAAYALACVKKIPTLGWRLMAAGFAAFAVAQAGLVSYRLVLGISAPFPSWADLFFIGGSVALMLSLWSFLIEIRRFGSALDLRRRIPLGAALIFGVGGWLTWSIVSPILESADNSREIWLSLVYPLLDLLLLLPSVLLFQVTGPFQGGQVRRVWATLLVGMALFLVGDLFFSVMKGTVSLWVEWAVDVSYAVGYAVCARAFAMHYEMIR